MRIVAELPHPECKITIFSMNQKFIVKFEKGTYEQTYKLSEIDITDGVNGVFQLIDNEFLAGIMKRFQQMRSDFNDTYNRHEV